MSEFRRDPISERWRIIAEGRSARPNEYAGPPGPTSDADCPFCEGREDRTPPEVAALRPNGSPPNGPGWTARAIPNKFPTVGAAAGSRAISGGPEFPGAPGAGAHEVIIESPAHSPSLPHLPPAHLRTLFRFFRERIRALASAPGTGSVTLFENQGPESGGTLPHPHAQVVATEMLPPRFTEEIEGFRRYAPAGGTGCGLDRQVAEEVRAARRVIHEDEAFVVFAPFASEYPYETWIVPRRHSPAFSGAADAELDRLAELLPALLRGLEGVRPNPSYNWFVHGNEAAVPSGRDFHWHVEIAPRLVRVDGYELGTGIPVNPVSPERAALELRAALARDRETGPRKR